MSVFARLLPSFAVLTLLAACGDSSTTTLDVRVVTSLVPGPEFNRIETTVLSPDGDIERVVASAESSAFFGLPYARGMRVAQFPNIPNGDTTVRVQAFSPQGSLLVEQNLRLNVIGSTTATLFLDRACVAVQCPSPGGSAALNACLGGSCVDSRCNPEDPTTREFCPDVTFCNSADDCSPVSACAEKTCVSGVCIAAPRASGEGACGENEWCNPDATNEGCAEVPATTITEDAGVDAGIICGTICFNNGNVCETGYWACNEGEEPQCTGFVFAPSGSGCGTGNACDGRGVCVPAADASVDDDASNAFDASAIVDARVDMTTPRDAGAALDMTTPRDAGAALDMTTPPDAAADSSMPPVLGSARVRFANVAVGFGSAVDVFYSALVGANDLALGAGTVDYVAVPEGMRTIEVRDATCVDETCPIRSTTSFDFVAERHYTALAYSTSAGAVYVYVLEDTVTGVGASDLLVRVVNATNDAGFFRFDLEDMGGERLIGDAMANLPNASAAAAVTTDNVDFTLTGPASWARNPYDIAWTHGRGLAVTYYVVRDAGGYVLYEHRPASIAASVGALARIEIAPARMYFHYAAGQCATSSDLVLEAPEQTLGSVFFCGGSTVSPADLESGTYDLFVRGRDSVGGSVIGEYADVSSTLGAGRRYSFITHQRTEDIGVGPLSSILGTVVELPSRHLPRDRVTVQVVNMMSEVASLGLVARLPFAGEITSDVAFRESSTTTTDAAALTFFADLDDSGARTADEPVFEVDLSSAMGSFRQLVFTRHAGSLEPRYVVSVLDPSGRTSIVTGGFP